MLPIFIVLTFILLSSIVYVTYSYIAKDKIKSYPTVTPETSKISIPTVTPSLNPTGTPAIRVSIVEGPQYTIPPNIEGNKLNQILINQGVYNLSYNYPFTFFELPLQTINNNNFEVRLYKYSIPVGMTFSGMDNLILNYNNGYNRTQSDNDVNKTIKNETNTYYSYTYKLIPYDKFVPGWYILPILLDSSNNRIFTNDNFKYLDMRIISLGTASPVQVTVSPTPTVIDSTPEPYIPYSFLSALNNGSLYYNIVKTSKLTNTTITLSTAKEILYIIKQDGNILSVSSTSPTTKFNCISISGDGNIVAYSDSDNYVYVIKLNSNNTYEPFTKSPTILLNNDNVTRSEIQALALNVDGSKLFISGNQYTAYLQKTNLNTNDDYITVQNNLVKSSQNDNGNTISVSLDDKILTIGDKSSYEGLGETTIYSLNNQGKYELPKSIKGGLFSTEFYLGSSVDCTNKIVVSGAPNGNLNKGAAYLVKLPSNSIEAVNVEKLDPLYNNTTTTQNYAYQGTSVAVSSDSKIVVVGAPGNKNDDGTFGSVYIYKNENGAYNLKQQIKPRYLVTYEQVFGGVKSTISKPVWRFGLSISLSENGKYLYISSADPSSTSLYGPILIYSI